MLPGSELMILKELIIKIPFVVVPDNQVLLTIQALQYPGCLKASCQAEIAQDIYGIVLRYF